MAPLFQQHVSEKITLGGYSSKRAGKKEGSQWIQC